MTHRIAKLVKDGLYKDAIALYARHHSASVPPTNFTFPYILKACAELGVISHGQMIHAHLLKSGRTDKHTKTDLTNMYMKIGLVDSAVKVFDEISRPNMSVLNVVVSGFFQNGRFEEALQVFKVFSVRNLRFDSVTVACAASACRDVVNGVQVHCLGIKIGVDLDENGGTSIMSMYFNCGEIGLAERLFELIEYKNVICYNAYMSGLVQNGAVDRALHIFNEMRSFSDERPNLVTLITVLSACGNMKFVKFGMQVHGLIMKGEFADGLDVGNGLVDMYSKCMSWQCAYDVFREMGSMRGLVAWNSMIAGLMLNDQCENAIDLFGKLEREEGLKPDLVTWNSMISGFAQLGRPDEAILFFRKMLSCDVIPNSRCLTSLLAACSSLSMQNYGRQIHAYVVRMKTVDDEVIITTIIDMYMKCGYPSSAYSIFCQFCVKSNDPAFWNAMISGYGRNGNSEAAFDIFNQMVEHKVKPNLVTLSCLLSVCSQTGEVDRGFQIFRLMTVGYGLSPTSKHMNTLIDLLSRSGRLDEAYEVLKESNASSASVFGSLLGASQHYSDLKLGEEVATRLLELEPENPIPFVILSNIYAGQEKWKDVHRIRKLMDKQGLKKLPGISSIVAA